MITRKAAGFKSQGLRNKETTQVTENSQMSVNGNLFNWIFQKNIRDVLKEAFLETYKQVSATDACCEFSVLIRTDVLKTNEG